MLTINEGVRGRLQLRGRSVVERLHGDGPTSGVQRLGALLGQLLGLPGLAGVGDEDGAMAAGQRGGLRLGVQAGAAVALVEHQAQQGVGQQQGQCPGPAGGVGGEQVRHGAQGLARRGFSQALPPRRGCIGWLWGLLQQGGNAMLLGKFPARFGAEARSAAWPAHQRAGIRRAAR